MTDVPIFVLNWKTNPSSLKDAEKLFSKTKELTSKTKAIFITCAPFPYLYHLKKLGISKKMYLGAQNVATILDGAETGGVSAPMLRGAGVTSVIVGHSEERALGEINSVINRKVITALKGGLTPILCIGEKERDHGVWYLHEVKKQLEECLQGVSKKELKNIMIAYEPVWAIGASAVRNATAEESQEMAIYIRKVLSDLFDAKTAGGISILYGGSVDESNAKNFLVEGGVQGLLVGRASLDPKKIVAMIS